MFNGIFREKLYTKHELLLHVDATGIIGGGSAINSTDPVFSVSREILLVFGLTLHSAPESVLL